MANTKSRLLAAAKQLFSDVGYTGAGVREIAGLAGVNNTLIARYFGSKAGLFGAVLMESINHELAVRTTRDTFASALLETLQTRDIQVTAMALKSVGDPEVRDIIAQVTNDQVIPDLAKLVGPPNAEERALNILILVLGYGFSTRILPVGRGDNPVTRKWFVQTLEQILEQP